MLLDRFGSAARAEAPREACGLLLGRPGRIVEGMAIANAAAEPHRAFFLDPAAQLRASREAREQGLAILGHYHSHPSGSAMPSILDAAAAREQGLLWLILADTDALLWISRKGGAVHGAFEPVELEIG